MFYKFYLEMSPSEKVALKFLKQNNDETVAHCFSSSHKETHICPHFTI